MERKHQPLEELDLVAFETDAQDAIDQWDGKMDAEAVLRLVAEVRRLREALQHLADLSGPVHESTFDWARCLAHRALAGQPLFNTEPPTQGTAFCPGCRRPFQTGFPVQDWARCMECHVKENIMPKLSSYPAPAKEPKLVNYGIAGDTPIPLGWFNTPVEERQMHIDDFAPESGEDQRR